MNSLKIFTRGCLPFILSSLVIIGCKETNTPTLTEEAHILYKRSIYLTNIYMDSILNCKDSSSIYQIDKHFDNRLTKLNYEYPAGTDYDMTEGENDTLTFQLARYAYIKDSLLQAVGKKVNLTDSVYD